MRQEKGRFLSDTNVSHCSLHNLYRNCFQEQSEENDISNGNAKIRSTKEMLFSFWQSFDGAQKVLMDGYNIQPGKEATNKSVNFYNNNGTSTININNTVGLSENNGNFKSGKTVFSGRNPNRARTNSPNSTNNNNLFNRNIIINDGKIRQKYSLYNPNLNVPFMLGNDWRNYGNFSGCGGSWRYNVNPLNMYHYPLTLNNNNYNINQCFIQNPSLYCNLNIQLNQNININQPSVYNFNDYSNSPSQKTSVDSSTFSQDPSFKFDSAEFLKYVNSLLFPLDEVLCTQKGTRETYKILSRLHPQCRMLMLNIVSKFLTKIMTDTYGNYFIQQILETAYEHQVHFILINIRKDFVKISKSFSGTHAMQALVSKITSTEDKNIVISAVSGHELEMGVDQSASHVLIGVLSKVREVNRESINKAIIQNALIFSLDTNGTCLLKKYIEFCFIEENKRILAYIFSENALKISQNAYGNYCMQFMLKRWKLEFCKEIAEKIVDNYLNLSLQKFSSNVVETVIDISDSNLKQKLTSKILQNDDLIVLLRNKFGRFVLQKAVSFMDEENKENLGKKLNQTLEQMNLKQKQMNLKS